MMLNWQKVTVMLWYRVEEGDRNLENYVQNDP